MMRHSKYTLTQLTAAVVATDVYIGVIKRRKNMKYNVIKWRDV